MSGRILALSLALGFLSVASACPPSPVPPDGGPDASPPPDPGDASPPVLDAGRPQDGSSPDSAVEDACARGETQLLALGCKDNRGRLIGGPTLKGLTWADVCRQNAALKVDMKPSCIAVAKTCAEVSSTCR